MIRAPQRSTLSDPLLPYPTLCRSLFAGLADNAERRIAGMDRLRPRDVVATLREWVNVELDLRLEAAAASELRDNFHDDADVSVPQIDWQRTGRRVMTSARIGGIPIEDREALIAAGIDPSKAAAREIGRAQV